MIYLVIALFLLSVLAKSNCDKKAFKEGGVELSDGRGWIVKTAFSFLLGKWHRWDAIRVISLCSVLTIHFELSWWYIIVFYIIHGALFETLYRVK